MMVEEKEASAAANGTEVSAAITAASKQVGMIIDINLSCSVDGGITTAVAETSNLIELIVPIPTELQNKATYAVYRYHGTGTDAISEIENAEHEKIIIDRTNWTITLYVKKFSTYAIAYTTPATPPTPSTPTTPSTPSPSTPSTPSTPSIPSTPPPSTPPSTPTITGSVNTNDTTDDRAKDNKVAVTNDFYHLRLTAKAAETSQKLTYTKISGADGYIIYGSLCGINNKMVKLADVSGKIASYNHKGLKKAKYYKYYVQAYKIVNGKKVVIATSRVIHSITTSKTYANPTKVVSDTSAVIISVGTSKEVTCKVILPDSKKIDNHTSVIRYETTNKEIATVSKSGRIKAMSKGTCYIFAYAQNGVYIKIKVTIK
jgi:hypothetical protein